MSIASGAAVLLAGAVVAVGFGAASAQDIAAPAARLASLPGGDHVLVRGARTDLVPAPGHGAGAITSTVNGRTAVVPADVLAHVGSLDDYQVSGPTGAQVQPRYAMSLLHVTATDHEGAKAAAEVVVVNTDDPARATWDGVMSAGDSRIEVPAGHYSVAVGIFDSDAKGDVTEADLLSATDVTVTSAGTTVALDGRSARPLTFTTPRPSTFGAAAVAWNRGTATNLATLSIGAVAGTPLYVGSAAAPAHGVLDYDVVGRQTGPGYAYVVDVPRTDHIPADQTYAVPASSLATVDSSYPTDQPGQDIGVYDGWQVAGGGPSLPDLPELTVHAPTSDRRYVSAGAPLRYDGLLLPNNSLDGELERRIVLTAGEHLTLPWRGGLIVPAPATYDGPCFLCRQGNTLHGIDAMDTDSAGDIGQWSDGPTTLTEDGTTIYSGTTMGVLFDKTLPAAKHHYVYSIDTTHDTSTTELSTHSQISWGYDSAQVTASTVPASWNCTPCAPEPILYASTSLTEDGHDSVEPGPANVTVSFQHQAYAPDPAVTSASVSVSYDDGATWLPTTVTSPDAHHAVGTWTVPADAKPGYLAVRLHAMDAAGSTVDETVHHAALVNAPGGIAGSSSGGSTSGDSAVCPAAAAGHVRCLAVVASRSAAPAGAVASRSAAPAGLARADLLSAYKLPDTGGAGRTVAIVDAHDDPTAEADLAVYRATYGLPACTTANGCFTKLNEHGRTSPLPPYDPSDDWSIEVSLDLDMVSAVCPLCHITLVESDDTDTASMGTAERAATGSGAVAVSNSWGGDESSADIAFDSAFSHAGVAVTASSGDNGFEQASWPASLSTVVAVGGTTLKKAVAVDGTTLKKAGNARGWTETAWSGSGSGCSAYTAKPDWQHDAHCPMRTAADVAAVADPKTGLAVYVQGSWGVVGGTSASSPIVVAMIALAGNSASMGTARYVYQHAGALFDVTSGSNANWDCGGDYLCTAGKGYDGPTGLGTPDGLGAL
jgi:hypothetical protein